MNSGTKSLLLISVGPKTAPVRQAHRLPNRRRRPFRSGPDVVPSCPVVPTASLEQQRSKVGFPIRKFSDQSLFAAPRDLSQRTTSFIASQRQGIHRIPFWHLIVLIIEKPDSTPTSRFEKTILLQTHPGSPAVKHGNATESSNQPGLAVPPSQASRQTLAFRPDVLPLHDVRYRRQSTDDRGQMILRRRRQSPSRSQDSGEDAPRLSSAFKASN